VGISKELSVKLEEVRRKIEVLKKDAEGKLKLEQFEDEDGGKWIPGDTEYYGEVAYTVSYKGETESPFDWLYIDYNTLQNAAHANGLNCELVLEGEHFDYLARLTLV